MASVTQDRDDRRKRQKARNRALMIALFALAALFYVLAMVKFSRGGW